MLLVSNESIVATYVQPTLLRLTVTTQSRLPGRAACSTLCTEQKYFSEQM